MNEYLSPQELADRWNVSRVWLYTLKRRGDVPKFRKSKGKTGRVMFKIGDVMEYEEKHFNQG